MGKCHFLIIIFNLRNLEIENGNACDSGFFEFNNDELHAHSFSVQAQSPTKSIFSVFNFPYTYLLNGWQLTPLSCLYRVSTINLSFLDSIFFSSIKSSNQSSTGLKCFIASKPLSISNIFKYIICQITIPFGFTIPSKIWVGASEFQVGNVFTVRKIKRVLAILEEHICGRQL